LLAKFAEQDKVEYRRSAIDYTAFAAAGVYTFVLVLAFNPLTPTVSVWVYTTIKHPVPDMVKASF